MEHDKKIKWKKAGWIGLISLIVTISGVIIKTSFAILEAATKVETTMTEFNYINHTLAPQLVQEVNELNINKSKQVYTDSLQNILIEDLEWRTNRLDKVHKLPPRKWQNINVE